MVKYCWSLRLWLFFHILFWHWNKHFSFTKQSAFSYCDLLKQDMERPTWDKLLCIYLIENGASTGNGLNLSHSFPQFLFIFKLQGLRWKKKKKQQNNKMNLRKEVQPLQYRESDCDCRRESAEVGMTASQRRWDATLRAIQSPPYECSLCTNVHDTRKKKTYRFHHSQSWLWKQ